VRETFAQVPGVFNEREGRLTTEWYNAESEPGRRHQVDIRVGEVLETYALTVDMRLQQRGLFGLWIEQGSYWDPRKREFVGLDPFQQEQELEDRLLVRARELAPGTTD
jgi:hypothetical protein